MALLEILLISFGVSIDAFAVSTSGSLCKPFLPRRIQALNAALFFGIFQFIMPVIGFFLAGLAMDLVRSIDHYVAFALLGFVGGKMIYEAVAGDDDDLCCKTGSDFFAVKNLFVPATATSLDALAVGAGFAFSGRTLWLPAASMGIITAAVSAFGVMLGSRLRNLIPQKYLTAAGGAAIIIIGAKILITDLFF
ncbi:MAG: manganese efflux pump [Lentisphaerae bacterium]|nr:manganese efflux pump [Lentisphaerota bacterium]